jgi:membrane protein implicated in regulation of membrane protease activity
MALAVAAPLPMLAMGTVYLLTDVPGDGPFADVLAAAHRQTSTLVAMSWVQLVFSALLVPAVLAVAVVTRRRAPRLTAAGVVLTVPGFALGIGNGAGDTGLALTTVRHHLDPAAMTALDDAWQQDPVVAVCGLLFIIGIVIGLLLLGTALARSGAVPAWFGVALALGGVTHPFMPTHVLAAVGLYVAAVGFAGASLALLRTSDDGLAPAPERPGAAAGGRRGSGLPSGTIPLPAAGRRV